MLIGGLVSGGINMGMQYFMMQPGSFEQFMHCLNWAQVGIAAGAGAIGGLFGFYGSGLGASLLGSGLLGSMGAGALGSMLAGAGYRTANAAFSGNWQGESGNIFDPKALITDFVFGAVGGGVGYRVRGLIQGKNQSQKILLSPPKMHNHHIFPRKFQDYFSARGIDIDLHTIELSQGTHLKGVHGRGGFVGPGNKVLMGKWNSLWEDFIINNPNATDKEIYQFGGYLLDTFGLNNFPIVPY
jgi:hypothetical protein